MNELKEIIKDTDTSAFIVVTDVSEIIGTHMKMVAKLETQEEECQETASESAGKECLSATPAEPMQ